MDKSKLVKVRPFCSPTGRIVNNAGSSQASKTYGQTRSIAEWERVFTSRKRTILQKVCELDAITNCTIALAIASPYGGVWYYASTEAVKMCMAQAGLINKDSQQVTIDSIGKKVMTENFTTPKPESWLENQRNSFGSIPMNPYLYNPLNMMQHQFDMPLSYAFQNPRQPHLNHEMLNQSSPLNESPPISTSPLLGNNNNSSTFERSFNATPENDKTAVPVAVKQEPAPTVNLVGSNSSSSESESSSSEEDSSSTGSEEDLPPPNKRTKTSTSAQNGVSTRSKIVPVDKVKKAPVSKAPTPMSVDKKKNIVKIVKQPVIKDDTTDSSSSSSESSSSEESSSSSSESENETPTSVVSKQPAIIKSEQKVNKNQPVKKLNSKKPTKPHLQIKVEPTKTPIKKIENVSSVKVNKEIKTKKTATKRKASAENVNEIKTGKDSVVAEKIKPPTNASEHDLSNIPEHLKNKFAMFLKAEGDKKEPKKTLKKTPLLKKNKLKNNDEKFIKKEIKPTKNVQDPKPVKQSNANEVAKPEKVETKTVENKTSNLKTAVDPTSDKIPHKRNLYGNLVFQIKNDFESKLSQKNIFKYPACHKLVKDKEEQQKFVYIPSLLKCNCFKDLREAISASKMTTTQKKDVFNRALKACKSLTLNKSGNSLKRVAAALSKTPEKNTKKVISSKSPGKKKTLDNKIIRDNRKKNVQDKNIHLDQKTNLNKRNNDLQPISNVKTHTKLPYAPNPAQMRIPPTHNNPYRLNNVSRNIPIMITKRMPPRVQRNSSFCSPGKERTVEAPSPTNNHKRYFDDWTEGNGLYNF